MDDLAFVRERIESYADYTNDDARRLADEQIRAYVGEALSRLNERLRPGGAAADVLSRLLLRCQFADQSVIRALDLLDTNAVPQGEMSEIHRSDRELAALADRADALSADELPPFLARINAAFDARASVITSGSTTSPAPPR